MGTFRPNDLNAYSTTACAPSVASPCPQCSAARRQPIVANHLATLKSLGSIDQTTQYLFASLLAFQNLSDTEKQQFTETIEANKKKISDVNIQFQALGFLFLTAVGEENFESAFDKSKKIQQESG